MITLCISCPELPERRAISERHFRNHDLDVKWLSGIHAETFGVLCFKPYRVNRPGAGELTNLANVGNMLSHYMAWQLCEHLPGDNFLILEDDAKFEFGWRERVEREMKNLPEDWDIFLIGSSHTKDKPVQKVNGEVYRVEYPFCTHAYFVRKKAASVLLSECRDCSANVDITLIQKAYPKLNVFTLLPRAVSQRGTELPE